MQYYSLSVGFGDHKKAAIDPNPPPNPDPNILPMPIPIPIPIPIPPNPPNIPASAISLIISILESIMSDNCPRAAAAAFIEALAESTFPNVEEELLVLTGEDSEEDDEL